MILYKRNINYQLFYFRERKNVVQSENCFKY